MKSKARNGRFFISILLFGLVVTLLLGQSEDRKQERKKEQEIAKYYDKWLNEDVVYIISDEERAVFGKLTTSEEKDNFIEQFWLRRAPDNRTSINEVKEEHYRRIAYANQHFGSGMPGWKSDRGRIYIMFGAPSEIEHHSGGGSYRRKPYEGGGETTTYPFEVWRYRFIPGIGDDVEIEFVDRSWTGEYKMAMNSWEKDLLLNEPGEGMTTAERLGLLKQAQRPGIHPGMMNDPVYQARSGMRMKDTPFESMMRYFALQRPPQIKQKELQAIVEARISFATLPLSLVVHQICVDSETSIVPITVEIANQALEYRKLPDLYKANVGLYGRITGLNGIVAAEFEDRIASEYREPQLAQGQKQKSLYQKVVSLRPGRYKLEMVIKDMNSGNVGTVERSIHVTQLEKERMAASPIVLAKMVDMLKALPSVPQSFIIGDVKVVPNVTGRFKSTDELGVYLQVYNPKIDAATSQPAVTIEYTVTEGDKVLTQITDNAGNSIEYFSPQRLVLVRKLKLSSLQKGNYKLTVTVTDARTGQTAVSQADFEVGS
ncbi:MAG TPA: GWxTD domain-containing protein [Acidobacteriota bacterium]|jgi:GWxTD domain-containing protein|nr:GWxTD domain-containing protein [Acidobacteriota bacterium]